MNELRVEFQTAMSVEDCAKAFRIPCSRATAVVAS